MALPDAIADLTSGSRDEAKKYLDAFYSSTREQKEDDTGRPPLTHAVTDSVYDPLVDSPNLQPGDEVSCPHCHPWHILIVRHTEGTPYAQQMLYWQCGGGFYYAGQVGGSSRYEARMTVSRA
jgi:hypothetical protein